MRGQPGALSARIEESHYKQRDELGSERMVPSQRVFV